MCIRRRTAETPETDTPGVRIVDVDAVMTLWRVTGAAGMQRLEMRPRPVSARAQPPASERTEAGPALAAGTSIVLF